MQASRPLPRANALVLVISAVALGLCLAQAAGAQAVAPTTPATEASEIQRLIKDGQHALALRQIDEALVRTPKDAQMRFRRGVALSMLDRKAEALVVFQKLVEDHPDMPAPYNNMAVIYGSQGEYEKARGALERAIRTNPAYATAYQNLGDVYAQLASQAYTKALQLDKTDATVPPKLSLLRELTSSGPAAGATAKPVAPAAPAPVAASAARPAPSLATAKPAAQNKPAAQALAEVEQAVTVWAAAWSRRDMASYVAAYSADFTGQAASHQAWVQERRDRIASKKSIRVVVADLKVEVHGDKATARFRQTYASDALSTTSRKTLDLARSDAGKWLIRRETSGG